MQEKKINIAIDGPSGSGKGTTAKLLAKKLKYNYLDTGAMYRAVGLYMFENNITTNSFKINILNNLKINFDKNNNILLNNENVESKIRTPQIAEYASNFSKLKQIRDFLTSQQKEIVKQKGFIAEGRDIGSIVIPDAKIKIYLTASLEARAKRRFLDFKEKKISIKLDEVILQLKQRDEQDMKREIAPLIKCDDAIEIDTSNLSIKDQVNKIYKIYLNLN